MSVESDLLGGLRTLLAATAGSDGTLFQLSETPDEQWAVGFTRGPTDPLGRWGQGVVTLITRGDRANPLAVHDLAGPLATQLATVAGATFRTVTVNWLDHRGYISGPDSSKRTIRADTFFADLDYQA